MQVLDLFCGAGGFSEGFWKIGFKTIGVDIFKPVGKTYELITGNDFIKADLSKEFIDVDCDIIVGGPPCKP